MICSRVIGQVTLGLCWWQQQSCVRMMKAVRLPGAVAGTGDVSLDDEALCPAVPMYPVSQTIFSVLFLLMDHL